MIENRASKKFIIFGGSQMVDIFGFKGAMTFKKNFVVK